ncbi:thioredoxin domain-containing protein 11 isoform X2 [Hemibagrus wyckioides]|uniref:thioredoxin domain-containing protein 11 isoform X2 n=1 Tax=Hemibagrus wyckioides TaxID=337641 RepID=UPI00266D5DBA|nr:thioredoxin domain-containing protein 11 isoform X2 [Hemibagrus wyckioides]
MKGAEVVRVVREQMARRPGMLCAALLLTCALILALTLTCSRAKSVVALARPPVRFLSPSVPVVDLYLGQQDQVEKLLEVSDVSVLFYYAPWCAHSITTREHLQQVALRLADQVQFVAVNCWWHQGKCRKQQAFFQYPVLHLYYRRFGPIHYKGPLLAEYIESFIRRVSAPLTYLPSRSTLHNFLSHHEGVVGFFDFNSSPQPPGYLTFLLSALHVLRKDPHGVVRFGVVTNQEVAAGMWVTAGQSVYLHRRFNTSLVFPHSGRNFTPENICNWVFENRESVITWIQLIGEKSHALEAELHKGPALLVFLPQTPLSTSQELSEVVDVALHYHSCLSDSVSSSVWSPSGSVLPEPRFCKSLHKSTNANANSDAKVCEVCVRSERDLEVALDSFLRRTPPTASSVCSNTQRSYTTLHLYTACCRTLIHRLHPLQEGGVTGLHCRTNKTLRFYALDSRLTWPLAQRLGAMGNHSTHTHTFTTIVNLRDDTHYVLQDTGREALERFIMNFSATYSPLHRHLVGVSEAPPTHSLIQEVTTQSFRAIVIDTERDVLLFYYTGWCGFCTVLNHVLLRLARLFQGNSAFIVARVNVGLNDLPWEFMVDRLPTFLFFPRQRKQMSVKFPENTRITLPNLVRFILNHSSPSPQGEAGPKALLKAEFRSLQGEVLSLQRARERLSQQLAALWRENRRLALHTQELQSHNAELQEQSTRLETLYQEKSRQLTEAVKKLQELADASEDLLNENSLLKVLLTVLREKGSGGGAGGQGVRDEDRWDTMPGLGEETEVRKQDVS